MTNHNKSDTPGVRFPPPVIVAGFLGVGIVVDRVFKTGFGETAGIFSYLGFGLIGAGALLMLWCALLYRRAKTSILPHTEDSAMIETGPFGFSRNPIYLAMLLIFAGICLAWDAPVGLVFLIPTIYILRTYVIAREEAYLIRRFGEVYMGYQERVRRWL